MNKYNPFIQLLVRAENNASLRTKNRIRDNGPVFMMEEMTEDKIFISSKTTDWAGWIPKNEIFFIVDKDWDYR